jgi:DTW domain-containing protein
MTGAKLDNRLFILVLQHPREQKESAATAHLIVDLLRRARVVVGLSWPNLARALGEFDGPPADPRRWAVLHLGSARPRGFGLAREIVALDRHGQPMPDQETGLRNLDGAVLLDGSWSEAKALWWRNPWLLKLRRLVLDPTCPSAFNRVRREPRREALSTIEAAALLSRHIERRPDIETALLGALNGLIAAARPGN